MCVLPVGLVQWFSTGDDFAPRRPRAVSGDDMGDHDWGGGGLLLAPRGWRPRVLLNILTQPQMSTVLTSRHGSSQLVKSPCPLMFPSEKKRIRSGPTS